MKTCNGSTQQEAEPFALLVEEGLLSAEELAAAGSAAAYRDIEIERILRYEYDIPRRKLLEALSWYHRCAWVEYDERLPVPPELLQNLDGNRLCLSLWFPAIRDGDTVIIAAHNPHDPMVHEEVKQFISAARYEFRVALAEDILFFIQDYLNATSNHIIGNERTGLAFWRNTLARWRTRLACYRTDFAEARTYLSLLRGGLGLITIGRALLRSGKTDLLTPLYWMMILAGFATVLFGLYSYRRIKTGIMSPPRHQTLVEVTAATLYVLENYQFVDAKPTEHTPKGTMLARLADMLPNSCVFIEPSL
ncbi:MAG TPA: type II secretion protein, partial [Syntrophobacteraceae bacterium]|nr:type II secretion protein [Syntrophobacteraceae bacterium]